MTIQIHEEIYVQVLDDGRRCPVGLNDELSQAWDDGTVYDVDRSDWRKLRDDELEHVTHIQRWIEFPMRVRAIFEQWTKDGWDINIMSDIMSELIELGVVSPDEEIAS